MLVKACLNGAREPGAHPRLPLTPDQLADDAQACLEFGAEAVHLHPRDPDGRESLAATDVAAAVAAVRAECPGLPIGVTTGAWIVPDPPVREAVVSSWGDLDDFARPDFASVNLSEDGWERVATTLLDAGIGVEAGIQRPEDPALLATSGLAPRFLRFIVEPAITDPDAAITSADSLLAALEPLAPDVPRMAHGREDAAWPVLEWALLRGLQSRIGLEDTLRLPDGTITPDNPALVAAAYTFLMESPPT
ncbi:MAG TPA: 3-keto-5-aminohexanoate cleavage protein [Micromonosporaceae bacterium]